MSLAFDRGVCDEKSDVCLGPYIAESFSESAGRQRLLGQRLIGINVRAVIRTIGTYGSMNLIGSFAGSGIDLCPVIPLICKL